MSGLTNQGRDANKALDAVSLQDRQALAKVIWDEVRSHQRRASCECPAIEAIAALQELGYTVRRRRAPAPGHLLRTNQGRVKKAAARDVAIAQRALDTAPHPGWPPRWGAVALARVELPEASLAEIGARIGVTKNSAAAAMRRIRIAVETQ